jgi:hypothetical protein
VTRLNLATYSLFLTIIFWGTLVGGIAYSHIAYFPAYLSDLPNSAVVVTGKYGIKEGLFWMTIHPLLILSLIITLALNRKFKARRKMILTTFAIYIVVLFISAIYFIPELLAFERSPESNLSAAEWLIRANRWQHLSWIRGTICYLAFIPLLVALTRTADVTKESEPPTIS